MLIFWLVIEWVVLTVDRFICEKRIVSSIYFFRFIKQSGRTREKHGYTQPNAQGRRTSKEKNAA